MEKLKIVARSNNGVKAETFKVNSIDEVVDEFTKEVMHANAMGYHVIPLRFHKIFGKGYNFYILGEDADFIYDSLKEYISKKY